MLLREHSTLGACYFRTPLHFDLCAGDKCAYITKRLHSRNNVALGFRVDRSPTQGEGTWRETYDRVPRN